MPREIFCFDLASGYATRIDAIGNISCYNGVGGWNGKAGADSLDAAAWIDQSSAMRIASKVIPDLIIDGIQSDPSASLIGSPGPLGGPTYEGQYPQGNRLMRLEDFPDPSRVNMERTLFDLDDRGRLARIRHPDTGRETVFDLAEESTPEISYVKSFASGAWVLEDVQIYPEGKPELFDPVQVVLLAREMAFETAEARRQSQSERVATPEGRRELERIRDEAIGTGLSQSTKRFALILTGLIVIAVGSLAWWKHRG